MQGDSWFATTRLMLFVFRSMKFFQQQFDRFMIFVEKCIMDGGKLDFRTSWPMDLQKKEMYFATNFYRPSFFPLSFALFKKLIICELVIRLYYFA